jgi:hypothetical protein
MQESATSGSNKSSSSSGRASPSSSPSSSASPASLPPSCRGGSICASDPGTGASSPSPTGPRRGPCDAGDAALGPGDRRKFRGAGPPGSDLLRGQAFRCGFLCVFLWLCCADWHRRPGRAGEGGCRWLRVLARRAFSFRRSRRDATALVGGAGGISGTNKWMWANMFW